jgi:peptidoglycan/LPS O-acetylase OafA/YrhL
VVWGALAGIAVVLGYRLVLTATLPLPYLTYYRTDTRADALLIGAAVAGLAARGTLAHIPARALRLAAAVGIAVLSAGVVRFGLSELDGIGYTLVGLAAAAVVAVVVAPHDAWPHLERALSCGPLASVGRISYGVYLFHIVVWQGLLAPHISSGPVAAVLTAVLTIGIATASFRYLETPFLRMKERLGSRRPAVVPELPLAA